MASVIPRGRELPAPHGAEQSPDGLELLSVWYIDNRPYVSVKAGAWKDPAAYGMLIADVARHVAHAHGSMEGQDTKEVLQRMLEGFSIQIDDPSHEAEGKVIIEP
jgi:hypothetical protein